MAYVLEHTKFGFCWWDLLALLLLVVVVAVYLVRRHNLKKEQKELEDQLADLYAGDSVEKDRKSNRTGITSNEILTAARTYVRAVFLFLCAMLFSALRVLFQALADPAFLCARESCLFTLPARPRILPFCASRAVCESLFSHFSCRRRSLRGSPQNLQHKSSHSKNKFAGFLTRLGRERASR